MKVVSVRERRRSWTLYLACLARSLLLPPCSDIHSQNVAASSLTTLTRCQIWKSQQDSKVDKTWRLGIQKATAWTGASILFVFRISFRNTMDKWFVCCVIFTFGLYMLLRSVLSRAITVMHVFIFIAIFSMNALSSSSACYVLASACVFNFPVTKLATKAPIDNTHQQ